MKTSKVVAVTVVVTVVAIAVPILAFVAGMNYEKGNSAEIQAKASALVRAAAPAPSTPAPKQ